MDNDFALCSPLKMDNIFLPVHRNEGEDSLSCPFLPKRLEEGSDEPDTNSIDFLDFSHMAKEFIPAGPDFSASSLEDVVGLPAENETLPGPGVSCVEDSDSRSEEVLQAAPAYQPQPQSSLNSQEYQGTIRKTRLKSVKPGAVAKSKHRSLSLPDSRLKKNISAPQRFSVELDRSPFMTDSDQVYFATPTHLPALYPVPRTRYTVLQNVSGSQVTTNAHGGRFPVNRTTVPQNTSYKIKPRKRKCPFKKCDQVFSQPYDYHKHMKFHAQGQGLTCDNCDRFFINKENMLHHVRLSRGCVPGTTFYELRAKQKLEAKSKKVKNISVITID